MMALTRLLHMLVVRSSTHCNNPPVSKFKGELIALNTERQIENMRVLKGGDFLSRY